MADDRRHDERAGARLRVRLGFGDLAAFRAGYADRLSRGGAVLEGVAPRAVGSVVRFEVRLEDDSVALRGEGRVVAVAGPGDAARIALRFTRLDERSRALIDELAAAGAISGDSSPPPPGPSAAGGAATGAKAPRVSVAELDRELDELARGVPAWRDARRPATGGLDALERELAVLAGGLALAPSRPASVAQMGAPVGTPAAALSEPPRRSTPPRQSDFRGLPAVLAFFGVGDDVQEVLEPVPSDDEASGETDRPPPRTSEGPMREPTPEPPRDDLEPVADVVIPQAPLLPGPDISAIVLGAAPLPDLDLDAMLEPMAEATVAKADPTTEVPLGDAPMPLVRTPDANRAVDVPKRPGRRARG